MRTTPSAAPPVFSVRNILLVVIPCAVLGLGYLAFVAKSADRSDDRDYMVLLADYDRRFGPRAKLDETRYEDKDGDLLADPPSESADHLKPAKLIFSGLSQDDPERSEAVWKDLSEHLGKEAGLPVVFAASLREPEQQLAALRDGKLHVTAFSTGMVTAAVNAAGFHPVCVPADAAGSYAYQMEIIVPADSPVRSPADLRGRMVTFSNMTSNAGLKAPVYLLRANFGMDLGRDYSFNISGGYNRSIEGIAKKRFQAAAVANDFLRREIARGTIREDQFRSIYKSENFPPFCFGLPHHLDPALAKKLRAALLGFDWKGTSVEEEYGPAGLARFVEVNYRNDWAFVRAVDEGIRSLAAGSR